MNDNVIIRVNNTNSTNNLLRNYNGEKGTLTIATADYQTNGRQKHTLQHSRIPK